MKEEDWGTKALENVLEEVKKMTPEEYEKLFNEVKKRELSGTIQEQIKQLAARRNCYCNIWDKDPDLMKKEGYIPGFCGKCEICGKDGHMCHFPGPVPYTGSWCDYHYYVMYRLSRKLNRNMKVII